MRAFARAFTELIGPWPVATRPNSPGRVVRKPSASSVGEEGNSFVSRVAWKKSSRCIRSRTAFYRCRGNETDEEEVILISRLWMPTSDVLALALASELSALSSGRRGAGEPNEDRNDTDEMQLLSLATLGNPSRRSDIRWDDGAVGEAIVCEREAVQYSVPHGPNLSRGRHFVAIELEI